eukprot:scaffold28768_cov130-Isochrysis_galbana.AAC.4
MGGGASRRRARGCPSRTFLYPCLDDGARVLAMIHARGPLSHEIALPGGERRQQRKPQGVRRAVAGGVRGEWRAERPRNGGKRRQAGQRLSGARLAHPGRVMISGSEKRLYRNGST